MSIAFVIIASVVFIAFLVGGLVGYTIGKWRILDEAAKRGLGRWQQSDTGDVEFIWENPPLP